MHGVEEQQSLWLAKKEEGGATAKKAYSKTLVFAQRWGVNLVGEGMEIWIVLFPPLIRC